jgi:hypothetical protein
MDSTYVGNENLLQMTSTKMTGVNGYYYNYGSGIPLFIMIPYQGAIDDAITIIENNLVKPSEKVLTTPVMFEHSMTYYYDEVLTIKDTYNEKVVRPVIPAFMPKMSFTYSLQEAKDWASENGVSLQVNLVRPGDSDYDENIADGTIISQSVKYGTLLADMNGLTINVVLSVDDSELIPDFLGMSYSNFNSWCATNGYTPTFNWIEPSDSDYKSNFAGLIGGQGIEAGSMISNYSTITVYAYDYPKVSSAIPNIATTTKANLVTWATTNLIASSNLKFTYVYNSSTAKNNLMVVDGFTFSNPTGRTSSTSMKTNSIVTAKIYTTDATLAEVVTYTVTFVDEL